jgi:hypothetical protein
MGISSAVNNPPRKAFGHTSAGRGDGYHVPSSSACHTPLNTWGHAGSFSQTHPPHAVSILLYAERVPCRATQEFPHRSEEAAGGRCGMRQRYGPMQKLVRSFGRSNVGISVPITHRHKALKSKTQREGCNRDQERRGKQGRPGRKGRVAGWTISFSMSEHSRWDGSALLQDTL